MTRDKLIELYKTIAYEQITLEIESKFDCDSSNFSFPPCTEKEALKALEEFIAYLDRLV